MAFRFRCICTGVGVAFDPTHVGGTTMSTAIWVVAVVAAAVYLAQTRARTRRLKRRFGPEYDRTVRSRGGRGAAERELLSRERRHEELELHELDPARREQYREQ